MTTLDVNGTAIPVDSEGYLENLNDWSEQVAEAIAEQENLTLTAEHWDVLHVLRGFYQEYEQAPAMRPFVKAVGMALGADKGKSIYLMTLFPDSPAKLAAKIAGLPKPTNCL